MMNKVRQSIIGLAVSACLLYTSPIQAMDKTTQVEHLREFLGVWEFVVRVTESHSFSMWYFFNRVSFLNGVPVLEGIDAISSERILIQPTPRNVKGLTPSAKKALDDTDFVASTSTSQALEGKIVCSAYYFRQSDVRAPGLPLMIHGIALILSTSETKAEEAKKAFPTSVPGTECLLTDEKKNEKRFTGIKR